MIGSSNYVRIVPNIVDGPLYNKTSIFESLHVSSLTRIRHTDLTTTTSPEVKKTKVRGTRRGEGGDIWRVLDLSRTQTPVERKTGVCKTVQRRYIDNHETNEDTGR